MSPTVARRARRTIGERLINRAHRPRRDGDAIPGTSLGGPDGGLATGVAVAPKSAEAERRATKATAAFMQLHPDAAMGDRSGPLLQTTSLTCEERDNSAKAAFPPTPPICEPKMDGRNGATPAESRPAMIVWTARRKQPFDWHGDIGSPRPGQAFSPLDQYLRRTPIIRRDYPE